MMRVSATEHDMVLAFLKAEVDSPRFGPLTLRKLDELHASRAYLIDDPDLTNERHNLIRIEVLKRTRGYQTNEYLFKGFPAGVQWNRVKLETAELANCKYANVDSLRTLSEGTRLVKDGAKNIDRIEISDNHGSFNVNVKSVAKAILEGKRYPQLILVESGTGGVVLMEGHTRATAYVLVNRSEPIDAYLGSHASISNWHWY